MHTTTCPDCPTEEPASPYGRRHTVTDLFDRRPDLGDLGLLGARLVLGIRESA